MKIIKIDFDQILKSKYLFIFLFKGTKLTIRNKKFIKIRRKLQKKKQILGELTFEANNFLHELREIDNSLLNKMNIDMNLNWSRAKKVKLPLVIKFKLSQIN